MKFISYAQNFEDVMLRRALKRVKKGFYVDVGAQDPVRDSVSKAFYEMGWHGINIEPVPFWFEKLRVDRPRDINLRVAASSSDGEMTLYEVKDSGLSTTDVDYAKHYSQDGMEVVEHSIQKRTLTSILADAAVQEIHFLKVDVEGAEESVLRGMDFGKYRPWIILVEARLPNSTRDAFRSWESIVVSAEYTFAWDDGLNRFYYANEHSRLARAFRFPPNVFDQFVRYSESQSNEALNEVQASQSAVVADRDELKRWAQELEAKLAQAEASSIAAQAGSAEQLEAQHQDLLKLDAALKEAQTSQSAVAADRDELKRWAHELEAKLAEAEMSSIAAQAGSAEQLEAQHQDLLKLDAAMKEAQTSQSAVVADRDELERWAHELEAKLAQAEASSIAAQAGLAEQLEMQQQDLLKLDAALKEAQASQFAVAADRDELKRWAHELEAKLAEAETSSIAAQADLAEQLETQQQDLLKLDAALKEAQTSQFAVAADRDELKRWAHELEAKLAEAETSSIAAQADLAEQLEMQQQDLLKLDAALKEAQASQFAVAADRDELERWARGLEAKLAEAEASMYQGNLQLADALEQLGQIKEERRVVNTELLGLHAQVGNLLAQLGEARHASAEDAKAIASLNDEIARWKEQHEKASNDNDHLRRAKQGLMEEVSRKEQEIALTERETAAIAQLLAARIAEVERLHRSRSWRLTSPLRRVACLLGAFRRRGISGTMKSIALRHWSSVGRENMDSCADGKSSLPKTAPTIQDVLLSKHIESLEGVRRKIRQRLDDEDKGR